MAQAAIRSRAVISSRPGRRSGVIGERFVSVALPIILGCVALGLRLHGIAQEPLWLDEGYTLLFSGLPFDRLLLVGGAHEHPPLFYSLVHLIRSLHDSYLVPRYISAVAGALCVVALYGLGVRLFGRLAGIVAAVLMIVSPFHIWYGQDGRGYELAGLLVVLSYLCLFSALDRPARRLWIAYATSLALCLYAEYTTVLVLLPQALVLLRARQSGSTRRLLLSWGAAGLAFLPWAGMLALNVAAIAGDYWIPAPTGGMVSGTVLEFFGLATPCPAWPCTGTEAGLPGLAGHEVVFALMATILVAVTLVFLARECRLVISVLALWMALPFALVLLLALRRSLYLDRTFLDATFALYLILGFSVAALIGVIRRQVSPRATPGVVIGSALALLALAGSLAGLGPVYAGGSNPDWRSAARDFLSAYRPGQAVVFNPGVLRSLLGAYLPSGWHATFERPLWSRSYLDVPGWQSRYHFPSSPDKPERQREEAILRNAQLAEAAHHSAQVWLITYDYSGMNDTRKWFSTHGFQCLLSELYDGDTRIELWSRWGPQHLGPAAVSPGIAAGWQRSGDASQAGNAVRMSGRASLTRGFSVTPGEAYSVGVEYRGIPPAAKPLISVQTFDRDGKLVGTFPRTMWYDWPVNGVWLRQPFGFVAPPGAVRAVVTLGNGWGTSYWRALGVYEERPPGRYG